MGYRTTGIDNHCLASCYGYVADGIALGNKTVVVAKVNIGITFKISDTGTVCGSYVLDGKIARGAQIRVVRDGIIIADDKVASLRRFKDDVKEVMQGFECGVSLDRFSDTKEGDILEAYIIEEYRPE